MINIEKNIMIRIYKRKYRILLSCKSYPICYIDYYKLYSNGIIGFSKRISIDLIDNNFIIIFNF